MAEKWTPTEQELRGIYERAEQKTRGSVRYLNCYCEICGRQINTWDEKIQKALGYESEICERCIAEEYGMEADKLRTVLRERFGLEPCRGI